MVKNGVGVRNTVSYTLIYHSKLSLGTSEVEKSRNHGVRTVFEKLRSTYRMISEQKWLTMTFREQGRSRKSRTRDLPSQTLLDRRNF